MSNNNPYLIPVVLLIVLALLSAGYYYQKNNANAEQDTTEEIKEIKGEKTAQPTISVNEYTARIVEIRNPINDKVEELLPKLKYKTLFEQNQINSQAQEIIKMIDEGINKLENVNIAINLKEINDKEILSLKYLSEAMSAIIAMNKTSDTAEKQKQSELLNYKIEESNRILKEITFPTNASGSSSGTNSIDILQ